MDTCYLWTNLTFMILSTAALASCIIFNVIEFTDITELILFYTIFILAVVPIIIYNITFFCASRETLINIRKEYLAFFLLAILGCVLFLYHFSLGIYEYGQDATCELYWGFVPVEIFSSDACLEIIKPEWLKAGLAFIVFMYALFLALLVSSFPVLKNSVFEEGFEPALFASIHVK